MEITAEEYKLKELMIVSETSGEILNAPTFELKGPQKKRKRKNIKKFFEEIIIEIFPTWKRK